MKLNISNSLSLLRGILVLPMAIVLMNNNKSAVMIIGVIAFITDILDGYLARKLNLVTEFGKMIDPIADKIFMGTIVVIFLIQGKIPLWLGISMFSRDILILTGGIYAHRRLGYVIPSNYAGKLTMAVIMIVFAGIFTEMAFFIDWGPFFVIAALIISFGWYAIGMVVKLKENSRELISS